MLLNEISFIFFKKAIDVTSQKYELNQIYKSRESLIILIQALVRGFLTRNLLKRRIELYDANLDKIIKIQVCFRTKNLKN